MQGEYFQYFYVLALYEEYKDTNSERVLQIEIFLKDPILQFPYIEYFYQAENFQTSNFPFSLNP